MAVYSRRSVLELAAVIPVLWWGCAGRDDPVTLRPVATTSRERGAAFLEEQQQDDGAFREHTREGPTTGQLHTGLCALALTELIGVQGVRNTHQVVSRALAHQLQQRARNGAIGFATETPEEPLRATALTIRALYRTRPRSHADTTAPMLWWLRTQQLSSRTGFLDHPDRGGFTRGWWRRLEGGPPRQVSLAYTRDAVQTMDAMGIGANDPALEDARVFLNSRRTADDGFAEDPDALVASVGSTSHGVMTLVCCDHPPELLTPHLLRLGAISRFPTSRLDLDVLATIAAVHERIGKGPEGWQDQLIDRLVADQQPDGSWNAGIGPLWSTAHALTALACAVRSWPVPGMRRR